MSKVLRGGAPPRPSGPEEGAERARAVIPGAVFDAEREATRILTDARAEAERVLTAARAEAEELRRSAAARGEAEGREAAVAVLVAAEAARARLQGEAEPDIARLALQIARKVVVGELAQSDAALGRIVAQALQSARLGRAVVVRIHPDDAQGLQERFPVLLAAAGRSEGLVLRPDPSLTRGGCVVDSELGTIDARLETQLGAIERALVGDAPGAPRR
jgi:flagellar biosynthesis/type III secretory pathway protein FliH